MALGEICCTIDISKTWRSSKTGFLFFLLLQMSLLSKVWTTSITASPATTVTSDAISSTVSEHVSQTQSAGPVSVSSSVSTDQMARTGSSVTGASSATVQNTASNSATVASTASANTSSSENYTAVYCPAFACTKDCFEQFMNTTMKPCPSSEYFCEIMKRDAGYSVSCSASCGMSCGNGSLSNCSVNCCNITNCLYNTLLALSNSHSTTVATTKLTTTATTIKTTVSSTQANNGKKCHNFMCNGAACYKTYITSTIALCPVGQDYCMLQKTTSGTTESWQGGCSTDCRKMTVCSSTTTACHLECCNATTTLSCLKLTGDVNIPSSATRGPHCPALLTASLLLFWIVKVFT